MKHKQLFSDSRWHDSPVVVSSTPSEEPMKPILPEKKARFMQKIQENEERRKVLLEKRQQKQA